MSLVQAANAYQYQAGQSALNNYCATPIRVTLDDDTVQRIAKAVVRLLQSPPDASMA